MKILQVPLIAPNDEPILAGRLNGKRAFLKVLEAIPPLNETSLVIVDFKGADLVTSSFLSEAILSLRDHLRLRRPPAYVVAANLSEKVLEELEEFLGRLGEALLVCTYSREQGVSNAYLVGKLESKLRETFDLISKKGETTAVDLHKESGDSDIGATAWNNRLSTLTGKSLVMEIPQGRAKKYRTVLEIRNGR